MANTEERISGIVSELHSYLQSWAITRDLPKFNSLINRLNKAVFIFNGATVKSREACRCNKYHNGDVFTCSHCNLRFDELSRQAE